MRYPVNNFKTEWNITAGNPFGAKTGYGYHEGVDINDNDGGNSDLGKEIFAIANGKLKYWHGAKHTNSGFGIHSVYEIEGPWGTRWVHQAHCQEDITQAPKDIVENERIARVGKSGLNPNDPSQKAHIHFSIFKVDPATLPNGIDTIAKTEQQLNDWWENPIKFIESQMGAKGEATVSVSQKELDELIRLRDTRHNALVKIAQELGVEYTGEIDLDKFFKEFKEKLDSLKRLAEKGSKNSAQLSVADNIIRAEVKTQKDKENYIEDYG